MVKEETDMRLIAVTRLLDHLGIATYNKYTKAIKELIANGYDADSTSVNVILYEHEIEIVDNGTGMDENDIKNGYMLIGSKHKRDSKKS